MSKLIACPSCSGFIPAAADACPNCDASAAPARRNRLQSLAWISQRLVQVAAGGAMAVTLMACYGAPAQRMAMAPQPQPGACPTHQDVDRDGHCPPADCDNGDPNRHPGATDTEGDGIDQNCDGVDGVKPLAKAGESTDVEPAAAPTETTPPSQPLRRAGE